MMPLITAEISIYVPGLRIRTRTVSYIRTASCSRPKIRSVSRTVPVIEIIGAFCFWSASHVCWMSSSASVVESKTTNPYLCRPSRPYMASAPGSPIHSCPAGLSTGSPSAVLQTISANVSRRPYAGSSLLSPPSIWIPWPRPYNAVFILLSSYVISRPVRSSPSSKMRPRFVVVAGSTLRCLPVTIPPVFV